MDLVQTCEHSKEGATRLQEIFTTQVTQVTSKKEQHLKQQSAFLEQYIVNQEKLKESAMTQQLKGDDRLQIMLDQIQNSYEARVLEKRRQEDIKAHEQLVKM